MNRKKPWILAGITIFSSCGMSRASADDLEKLQGKWIIEEYVFNTAYHLKEDEGALITIVHRTMSSAAKDGRKGHATLFIDESATPKQLTQHAKYGNDLWVMPGIYKIVDDRLIICFRRGVEPDIPMPPIEFRSDKQTYLIVLRRSIGP